MTELKGLDLVKKRTDDFHTAFGHPVSERPVELSAEDVQKRVNFIGEELVELLKVVAEDDANFVEMFVSFKDSLDDAYIKERDKSYDLTTEDKIVGITDALTDINVFVSGTFTMLGVWPQAPYDIVMNANMAKLGADGKPIYRESDGKIMKPENWELNHAPEPKLKAEIQKQLK